MRTILVLNAKGGCGKSTIATNLASFYASQGARVALADLDPQYSSLDWLEARPANRPPIHGVRAVRNKIKVPRATEFLIMDAPAATHRRQLPDMLRKVQSVVVPVLPSPIDMRAANRFVGELFDMQPVERHRACIATVANRVRENTNIAYDLQDWLEGLRLPDGTRVPFTTFLRQSQNYVRAAERGVGIFEMAPAATAYDREQWTPLLRWLDSPRSMPG